MLKNKKTANLIFAFSLAICIALQIFFPGLKHKPSISVERDTHIGVIKAGGNTYFSSQILSSATISIHDADIFSRGFLTDNHFNGIVTLALQSTFLAVVILLLLRKPIRQTIIFSAIAIFILYGAGCIYTYRWFQLNGIALSQSGYELVLPYGKDFLSFILIIWFISYVAKKSRPQNNAFE